MRYVLDVRIEHGRISEGLFLREDAPCGAGYIRLASVHVAPEGASALGQLTLDLAAGAVLPTRWFPAPVGGFVVPLGSLDGDFDPIRALAAAAFDEHPTVDAGETPARKRKSAAAEQAASAGEAGQEDQ